MTYRFSGHETFYCKHFWLKKGYDYIKKHNDFKSSNSVIELGVGKNMVASIAHWLKVYKIVNTYYKKGVQQIDISQFGEVLLNNKDGLDPYIEDKGTTYLLHYMALKNDYSSIYNIAFKDFRKTRVSLEFTSTQLFEFLCRKLRKEKLNFSEKSLKNDIKVFIRSYLVGNKKSSKTIEDDFSALLLGLDLINPIEDTHIEGDQVYKFEYNEKNDLDILIFLFAILDSFEGQVSISVEEIQSIVSDIFLCNREGTEKKLQLLQQDNFIVYKQDAGRKEIQLKSELNKWEILKKHYKRA